MKLIPRNINWLSRLDLPLHPSHLIEGNCPKCGEMAISNVRGHVSLNIGTSSEPSSIQFTCYGADPNNPKVDCDTEWEEKVILRFGIETV